MVFWRLPGEAHRIADWVEANTGAAAREE